MNDPNAPASAESAAAAPHAPDPRRAQILALAADALDRRTARRTARRRAIAGIASFAVVACVLVVASRAIVVPRAPVVPVIAAGVPAPVVHRSPDAFPRANVRVIDDLELRAILEAAGYRVSILRGPDSVLVRIDDETIVLPAALSAPE